MLEDLSPEERDEIDALADADPDPSLKYWIAADAAWSKAQREGKITEYILSCILGTSGYCINCAWPMKEEDSTPWHIHSMVNLKDPVTGMMQNCRWSELQHVCPTCVESQPSGETAYRGRFYRPHLMEEYNKKMYAMLGAQHMWIVPS